MGAGALRFKPVKPEADEEALAAAEPVTPRKAAGGSRKGRRKVKAEVDDVPLMDARLYNWLPKRAKDIEEDAVALKNMFADCDGEKWYIKIGWKTYDDPSRYVPK